MIEKYLFVKYDKNKNIRILSAPIPIKTIPEGTKVLCSIISPIIDEFGCSDASTFVAHHCENGSSRVQGVYFDQSYIPVAHAESFIFNIAIADMRRLTSSTLNVSNIGQNTNVPIHEIVCVSSPSYFLDWFEISYPNVPLNIDEVTFCIQCMN